MKNKSLITIILVSVITFVALVFSLYNFVLKKKTVFYDNGYVSITDNDIPSKAYFKKGTEIKKGYNEDIIFNDADDKKNVASIYSFAFYNDKSISYLNNGVLMGLDNLDEKFLAYYNIKSDYLIRYKDNKYVINSKDKDISFTHFIGRISDTKYIVAGNDLHLKLSSSEKTYDNYYFEFEFVEGSLVRITNESLNIETISDECYISFDNVKIDLSKKAIYENDDEKVKLAEIVIDSDQNIDIKYDDKKNDDSSNNGDKPNKPNYTIKDEYEIETVVDYKKAPYALLVSSNINSHRVAINFNISDENNLITSSVYAKLINLETGQALDTKEYKTYDKLNEYIYDNLKSNTKYMLTIYASYKGSLGIINDYVMFQRTFTTSKIGANLSLDYKTNNSLTYNVNIDKNAGFTSAVINLYDSKNNLVGSHRFTNNGKDISYTFKDLNPNSSYTAKIEDVSYGAVTYPDGVASENVQTTLKSNPFKNATIVPTINYNLNKKDYTITFSLENFTDVNKSFKNITYNIYDIETNELVKQIHNGDNKKIKINYDLDKNKIYYANAVVEINDNEKTLEYTTENSSSFSMGRKISPSISGKNLNVSATTITGIITIYDPDNTIDTSKTIYAEYKNGATGDVDTKTLEFTECLNEESETTKCAKADIVGLYSNTNYILDVYGYVDLKDENIPAGINYIDRTSVFTTEATIINTNLTNIPLLVSDDKLFDKVFEVTLNFSLPVESKLKIKEEDLESFDIMLYEGNKSDNVLLKTIHVDKNIKEEYFDQTKTLTLKDFDLTLDDLKARHDTGIISKNYVIAVRNGVCGTEFIDFRPTQIEFEINDALLKLTSGKATIEVEQILNEGKDKTLKDDTAVGIKIIPALVEDETEESVQSTNYLKKYIKKINYTIYDVTGNKNISDVTDPLKISDDLTFNEGESFPEKELYFTDYPYLKRGHVYVATYTLSIKFTDDGDELLFPFSDEDINKSKPVESPKIYILKEKPSIYIFPWESDEGSITYKYEVNDIDSSLATIDGKKDELLYFNVNDGEITSAEKVTCNKKPFYTSKFNCGKFSLTKGDNYNIYLNAKLIDEATYENVYANVFTKTFEGKNTLDELSFDILKNDGKLLYNNLLILKLNGDTSKIASFNLNISDGTNNFKIENISYNITKGFLNEIGTNKITYNDSKVWEYNEKDDNSLSHTAYILECDEGLCIYVDYSKLYNSKTFGNEFNLFKNKNLSVSLEALYDSGVVTLFGNTSKKYAIQTFDENNNYVLLFNRLTLDSSALGAYYPFRAIGDFVDDNETTLSDYNENNNHLKGNIYLKNLASKYFVLKKDSYFEGTYNYVITNTGANISINRVNTPVVAKELASQNISYIDNSFTYDNVVPSVALNFIKETINGAKLHLSLTGIKESDITKEDGKMYLYIEVGGKTIKVNTDSLISASGVVNNNKYKIDLNGGNGYLINLRTVSVDNAVIADYKYDYLNNEITFDSDKYNGKNITVTYYIVLYGLNVNEEYNLKMYMMVNNKKTYLADAESDNYSEFTKTFKTLSETDGYVTEVSSSVSSSDDYQNRTLALNYKFSDIIGFKKLSYEICSNGICLETVNPCFDSYNTLGDACVLDKDYNMLTNFDVTDEKYVYGANYNIKINAIIDTLSGEKTYTIYDSNTPVRKLLSPTLDVIKQSHHNSEDGYYLNFRLAFNDSDKVIKSGNYKVYLAVLKNGNYEKIAGTEKDMNIYNSNNKVKYTSLQENKQYYFFVEYDTYINNEGENPNESHKDRYLMFTLNNYHINTGITQYIANNYIDEYNDIIGKTTLRFGYAANIMKDLTPPESEDYIMQEAYVVGILYNINSIESSVGNISLSGVKMFDEYSLDDDDKITYVIGATSSSEVGDSYYQMVIKHNEKKEYYAYSDELLLRSAGYNMIYKFYLGGPITKDLNTKEKCLEDAASNKWNEEKNECYILQKTENSVTTRTEDEKRG